MHVLQGRMSKWYALLMMGSATAIAITVVVGSIHGWPSKPNSFWPFVTPTNADVGTAWSTPSDKTLIPFPVDNPLQNGPAPLQWNDNGTTYRAVHVISRWDVKSQSWTAISPDLTQAYVEHSDGNGIDGLTSVDHLGDVWYAGSLAGEVSVKFQGIWHIIQGALPERTVTAIRICPDIKDGSFAVIGYDGYSAATPEFPGHVYATLDAGQHWTDISGNLPNEPVEAIRFLRRPSKTLLLVEMNHTWYEMNTDPAHWRVWSPQG